ncbi:MULTISPECIES: hypothetical protein [unclassified Flavobacterium]|uniref:hypothetical protein n=1 Tax=unclassified Flavobacterium TaxID=196869 RepID=UPI001291A951|nr:MULTISPECIES: hypothetical protein [unclassified Flavobacterium]MQP52141.1 hypothetical protein [Flavobacterium sp. LMO9]MQP62010.1 hypothetical protein [Flavobacterium sp. LMO6]
MRNYIKLILALLVFISMMSFTDSTTLPMNTNSKSTTVANDTLTWKLLGDIKYIRKKHATYGEVEFPQVNMKLKMMQKKTIFMSGFIVPIDNKNYALSKNVFAACFFCGKSGPETIAGIKFKGGAFPKLKTDTYVTLKGTFRYNETDVEDWIYHIEDAVIVSQSK